MRLSEARRDHYRKLAKRQGYRSRSAYKLIQLDNTHHFLKPGSKVLDVGCAPGGWLQVVLEKIGPQGRVIGVDMKEVEPLEGAVILQGNIEHQEMADSIIRLMNGNLDVVLSDLAPQIGGIWDLDHTKQISLSRCAFSIASRVLRKGGTAIFKVFEGELLHKFKTDLSIHFHDERLSKPLASRQKSSELYIVCLNFRG
jgi:23S rRNA (uridine2552-2'-O)-methyltransferase